MIVRRWEIARLIRKRMEDVGAEVYYHKFQFHNIQFHPLRFFSSTPQTVAEKNSSGCTLNGVSPVGIIRAPRGDGKESIVLVTPYNSENVKLNEALSLALAYSVFSLLSRVVWLAKDIVWLAADSRYGEYTSVASWLKDYYNPFFSSDSGKFGIDMCFEKKENHGDDKTSFDCSAYDDFRRAGTMAAALVLKVMDQERSERDRIDIYAEASNGQMPNLDLINIVHYLAVHRQGLHVKVGTFGFLLNSALLKHLGETLQRLSRLVQSLNPGWKLGVKSADFIEGTATLASSMYYQALGVPTGPHGAFRDFQIDAITMELSPRTSLTNENGVSSFLLRSGRLVEGVVRSVNNLLEKFHQSFFLYFLTAPNKFVSVGVYMIAFALFVAPLPIVVAALFSSTASTKPSTTTSNTKPTNSKPSGSWNWLHSAKLVFLVHLWALIISSLPYFISQIPRTDSTKRMLTWSLSSLLLLYPLTRFTNLFGEVHRWEVLKSVMIAAASIGLSLMSIINFATAQVGSMLLVPLCLMVRPLKKPMQASLFLSVLLKFLNILLAVVAFPPASLAILKAFLHGFESINIGDFWEWAEFLWAWSSATYLYVTLVHLPCWYLCVHILLHN
ncbi:GPI transamidase component gaa1 isoform X2 [Phalaenopsis equestris]|uniref:GPI transamidase component gaa1 isoform X2 n=1 Tax=Phalaenopsis equestris TaxID=78828 RepID=UPI0009E4424F|nr:GPI transamidase component gaa1 isoform X2 [Phalaenopsis equestris]